MLRPGARIGGCATMTLARTGLATLLLAGVILTGASPARAQAPAEADEAAAKTLDEVVVTARKKSEPLQRVPMSIVALDAGDLRELGIDNLADVAAHVPGMEQLDLAITSRLS